MDQYLEFFFTGPDQKDAFLQEILCQSPTLEQFRENFIHALIEKWWTTRPLKRGVFEYILKDSYSIYFFSRHLLLQRCQDLIGDLDGMLSSSSITWKQLRSNPISDLFGLSPPDGQNPETKVLTADEREGLLTQLQVLAANLT